MPTLTSQSTAAAVCKARRRERPIQSRARSQVPFSRPSTTAHKRNRRRRQTRDRASFDVDDCFNICQDQGFHRDPDVHLGSGIRPDVNQFAVLEQDMSCPSTPPGFPHSHFTFTCPSPCSSMLPEMSSLAANTLSASVASTTAAKLDLKRCQWPVANHPEPSPFPPSPQLPSIPTTPPTVPKVKLPSSFPSSPPCASASMNSSGPGFLDGIKIPSPLLHHKRSRELLQRSSDDDINAELTNTFLLTCGREPPSPDFASFKLFEDSSSSPTFPSEDEQFVAAALPLMGSAIKEDILFRNIPRAPWIEKSGRSTPQPHNSTRTVMPSSSVPTTYTSTSADLARSLSSSVSTVIRTREWNGPRGLATVYDSTTADFAFPQLPMRAHSIDTVPKSPLFGLWKPPTTKRQFIDDDPVTIFKRWTAFEEVIQNPKIPDQPSPVARIKTTGGPSAETRPSMEALDKRSDVHNDAAICPTPPCIALVPARLYEHQYLGWPKRLHHQQDYQLPSYPTLSAPLPRLSDIGKVLKMTDWLKDFGCESQQVPKCVNPVEINSSFDEDFKISSEDDPLDLASPAAAVDAVSPPELVENPAAIVEDEGYFTCQESASEIGLEEANLSDDEWAEWDWEPAVDEGDEEQDLFGTGLGP